MKYLVTGGNRGLGLELVQHFGGVSISRVNGIDITKDHAKIAEMSLDYDVFINNAFDGPPQEPWANFGQIQTYFSVYQLWKEQNKDGWIFNIGSIGEKNIVAPEPMFETYRVAKSAMAYASKQGTKAFKDNIVPFKTSLITVDRLDTPLSRSRTTWTGNGLDLSDISHFIEYSVNIAKNSVVEEMTLYCNMFYDGTM